MILSPMNTDYRNSYEQVIGNKANNLLRCSKLIDSIPKWICITCDELLKIFDTVEGEKVKNYINMYLFNKVHLHENLPKIRDMILGLNLPNELCSEITQRLAEEKIEGPFAVRSSAIFEDGKNQSNAGLFETLLSVKKEDIFNNILKCWSSFFTERVFININDDIKSISDFKMGVIVQEMIFSEKSGVLFTSNPVNNSSSEMVIECSMGIGERMVSGFSMVSSYIYSLINNNYKLINSGEANLSENEVRILADEAKKLMTELGQHLDIEFGIDKSGVHILQCRPITTINVKKLDKVRIFAIHEIDDVMKQYLGELEPRYDRWKKKKIIFYKACHDNRVPCCGWEFINYNLDLLSESVCNELLNKFTAPYLYLNINVNIMDIHIPTNKLPEKLKELGRIYNGEQLTVGIRESFPTEISILTSMTANNQILIEYLPGALKGLNSGMLIPSSVIVSEEGEIIQHNKKENKFYLKFNPDTLKFENCYTNINAELSLAEINTLVCYTKKLVNIMSRNIVIEWWKFGNAILANDVSLIKDNYSSIEENNSSFNIISPGKIRGRVLFIDSTDKEQVEYLSCGRGISVMDYNEDINDFDLLKNLREKINQIKKSGNRVIVYLEKPYLFFSPLCECVDGFIFKNASALCHFSIILREKKVPAISLKGKNLTLSDLAYFDLDEYDL